jgi:hypothetical protein
VEFKVGRLDVRAVLAGILPITGGVVSLLFVGDVLDKDLQSGSPNAVAKLRASCASRCDVLRRCCSFSRSAHRALQAVFPASALRGPITSPHEHTGAALQYAAQCALETVRNRVDESSNALTAATSAAKSVQGRRSEATTLLALLTLAACFRSFSACRLCAHFKHGLRGFGGFFRFFRALPSFSRVIALRSARLTCARHTSAGLR